MTEPVTKQELIDASEDAQTLEDVVNGDDATDVTSRLARTYPTLAKALRLIVQNGLLGATAFNLKSEMDGSGLVDDDYAVVTDDPTPANNGFYQKQSGTFEFLAWNPINQFLSALAIETSSRVAGDADNATAISAESTARIAADTAESTTRAEQVGLINTALAKAFGAMRFDGVHDDLGRRYIFALVNPTTSKLAFGITRDLKLVWQDAMMAVDNVSGYKDKHGRYALAVKSSGKVYIPNLVLPRQIYEPLNALKAKFDSFNFAFNAVDAQGDRYIFAVINPDQQKIGFGITKNLAIKFGGSVLSPKRWPFLVMGRGGQAAIAVSPLGKVYIPDLQISSATLSDIAGRLAIPSAGVGVQDGTITWADVNHVIGDSQSLGRGATTNIPISTTQPYSNLTLDSGVLKAFGDVGYGGVAFKPLVEEVGAGTDAESPVSGYLNEFVRRCVADGASASDYVMLGTQGGVGGKRIADLASDEYFIRVQRHILDAKAIADANDQTYAVTAITWIQGESDTNGALWTKQHDYFQRYLGLMLKIRNFAILTSGQAFVPPIFSYQTSGHRSYDKTYLGIAMAQWRASVERSDFILTTPAYRCPHTVDNVHLNQEGSWLLGAYFGRALYWTLFLGKKWRPLEPIDVTWTATHVDVKYHVPCKPIQISTLICTATHNSGFDIWTNGSLPDSGSSTSDDVLISDAINSVSVISDDTIRITFDPLVSIPADAVLCYGRGRAGDPQSSGPVNGARGNIMDSHGLYDKATSPLDNVFDLYNVSVMFQHDRKTGF